MLIDTHCHLSSKDYKDIEGVLRRAAENDVSYLVAVGSGGEFDENEETVKLAEKYPQIFATVGIHPHDAKLVTESVILPPSAVILNEAPYKAKLLRGEVKNPDESTGSLPCRQAGFASAQDDSKAGCDVLLAIERLATHKKVVAIGEIGLDFHYDNSPRKVQEEVFVRFIDLAKKLNKPIVIHDRDAGERTYEILRREASPMSFAGLALPQRPQGFTGAVIHCFTGTKELAKKYLDLSCFLSFTGIITFPKAKELHEVVKMVPVERMMIETDSPYLAPEPYRGKKNEPAYVRHVAEAVAKIKGLSFEDVARITTLNAKRFFSLPLSDLSAEVAYVIRDSLYLNITNRCTLACTFCPKFIDFEVKGHYLKLRHEPAIDEILGEVEKVFEARECHSCESRNPVPINALDPRFREDDKQDNHFGNPLFKEIVFCGYGEPTLRLDLLKDVSSRLKKKYPETKIRLNTDGLGNLVHGRNILPELALLIDSVSVSLNAPDAETYAKYCRSKFREDAYPAVKDFIREATRHIKEVTATVVGLPDLNISACKKVVEELGAKFRLREYDNVG